VLRRSRAQFYTQIEIQVKTFNKAFSRLRNERAKSNVDGNFVLFGIYCFSLHDQQFPSRKLYNPLSLFSPSGRGNSQSISWRSWRKVGPECLLPSFNPQSPLAMKIVGLTAPLRNLHIPKDGTTNNVLRIQPVGSRIYSPHH
jgi:hypothetical protein